MTQSIISAGSSTDQGIQLQGGNDGSLVIQTGVAGSKVNAISIASDGTPTMLKPAVVSKGILQMLCTYDNGTAASTATTLTNTTVANQSITPKSTSSTIIVECTFNGAIGNLNGVNVYAQFQLYDVTNSVLLGPGLYSIGAVSGNGGNACQAPIVLKFPVQNTSLTTRLFQLRGLTTNASAQFGAAWQTWTLTEVQN